MIVRLSVMLCRNEKNSVYLLLAFDTLEGTLVNPIGVGDTNKPICCNCLSTFMYNVEAGSCGEISSISTLVVV